MPNTVITLNDQEITKLEQIIIDHDERGAWELLSEIRKKVRATNDTRCGVEKLRNLKTQA